MQSLTAAAAAIELRGIDKSFGAVHAVCGVSLAIPHGSITGIVGENGAGKSTLMSILYGLYRADAGQILIDDRPVDMAISTRCHRSWHRHGSPALHVGRHLYRPRKSDAGGRRRSPVGRWLRGSACRAGAAWPGVWPHRRSRCARGRSVGGRTTTGRDPEGPVPWRAHVDPGRAQRRADATGDRPAVRDPEEPARPRCHRGADHPQAARDHGRGRSGDRHAPGRRRCRAALPSKPAPANWRS